MVKAVQEGGLDEKEVLEPSRSAEADYRLRVCEDQRRTEEEEFGWS
jgi:hypothetical protein